MAEISLRAYQDKIASLAEEERFVEVIAHARHILKNYPKNLRAYEQLGRALFATGRWAEAVQVLRRMLGADPQDFATHSLLAQAYQALEQPERAIWHAERALDQQPTDEATISLIRELYRQHRGEEIKRLQMTAAALAQRHIRGNLLDQALETLDAALADNPQRLDLHLLRARTLWLDGQRMDAAEAANEILERLPYALDANRIMTELWLAAQRKSDAEGYLLRIEELDPYLAHQLAAGEPAPDEHRLIDELEFSSLPPSEADIVDPGWLSERGGEDSGLGALFGIGEAAPGEEQFTADLDDLLADDEIETLQSQLAAGEAVAEVSEIQFTGQAQAAPQLPDEADNAAEASATQPASAEDETGSASDALDEELAHLLEQLNDDLDEDGEAGDWMAEIQQGSLEMDKEEESLEYVADLEREWVKAPEDEESGGAPWLSAAMREALDKTDDDDSFDLFGDDEQLRNLLMGASDTQPIDRSDIADWLEAEPASEASESSERDERFLDIDEEFLHSPPADSWLADSDDDSAMAADDEDPNRLNADLIDSWQSELGDDDEADDPYVDWLKDDPNELDDDFAALSVGADESADEASALMPEADAAQERALAWGLNDADQLADFVEQDADADASSDWLNAVVPGLDRENETPGGEANEYARPMAAAGKEFAWVNEIVEEETGEMPAVEPSDLDATAYFRFSKLPAWLVSMQAEAAGAAEGIMALSVDADIDSLELDDLTFDDYFSFDTPTDKMDVINLEEDTQELNFVGLDWDDYFDLESPTEKTIAISLAESAADIDFDELGVDDDDFSFVKDGDSSQPASDADSDFFNDIGLGSAEEADDSPLWLKYDDTADEADLADDRRGQSTL